MHHAIIFRKFSKLGIMVASDKLAKVRAWTPHGKGKILWEINETVSHLTVRDCLTWDEVAKQKLVRCLHCTKPLLSRFVDDLCTSLVN